MQDKAKVLVCVTLREASRNILDAGRVLADANDADLEVLTVLPESVFGRENSLQALEGLHAHAKSVSAQMSVYFSSSPVLTAAAHIARQKPVLVVTGFPGENSNGFVTMIHFLRPDVPISMVDSDSKVYSIVPDEKSQLLCKR